MKDKSIQRLRFKFWLVLTTSFTTLMVIGGFLVYALISHNTYQEQRRFINSPVFTERVREHGAEANEYFTAILQEDGGFWIRSSFNLLFSDYEALVEWAMKAIIAEQGLPQLNNDWFSTLGRALNLNPSSHLNVSDRTWSFAMVEDFEGSSLNDFVRAYDNEDEDFWVVREFSPSDVLFFMDDALMGVNMSELQERMGEVSTIQQLVFVDVSQNAAELASLVRHLSNIGMVGFVVIGVFSYLFSYFLVRPIAKNMEHQLQFIADASHELKTPLTILKSNLGVVLASREETVESQLEWLGYMEFGLDRMTNLTRQLLMLSQLESPVKCQKSLFNLADTVERAVGFLQVTDKKIQWDIKLEPMTIFQDEDKLSQVIMILLDNAVKYVEPGGTIAVRVTKSRNQAKFSVTNTGPGIPPDKLPLIFERFYRGDESRNSEAGSYGLGLAIAKGIMTQLGGKIRAESIPDEKTTLSFTVKM